MVSNSIYNQKHRGYGLPLIACTECGKKISSQADSCIGCGMPLVASRTEEKSGLMAANPGLPVFLIALLLIIGVVALWAFNYAIGVVSRSDATCLTVAVNTEELTSFDTAFYCLNNVASIAAEFSGVYQIPRVEFLGAMFSLVFLLACVFAIVLRYGQSRRSR